MTTPKERRAPNDRTFTFTVDKNLFKAFSDKAAMEDRSATSQLRSLIKAYVELKQESTF